jgi:transcriptional regulator with XRE-family HTH domain
MLMPSVAAPISGIEMARATIDIERVKQVLREATKDDGSFSQRGLPKAAGLAKDAVYDIIAGRNKNPTIATLSSLAQALGGNLSMFGLSQTFALSEEELRAELEVALPHMPTAASSPAEQAQYLAEAVAGALGLPRTVQADPPRRPARRGRPAAAVAPFPPKA